MMSKLLIEDYPLIVLPKLAKAIGLNDSIFLQQLHYWLSNKKVGIESDGQKWVKNSVREWQEDNFPFWHTNTIVKIVGRLQKSGLVITRGDLNERSDDKTLWYSIDYKKLEEMTEPIPQRVKGQSHNVVEANTTTCETPIPQRGKSYIEQRLPETKEETTQTVTPLFLPSAADRNGWNRKPKQVIDGLAAQVKAFGVTMAAFRTLVDHVLAKHGQLEIANTDTDHGTQALRQAQECVTTLLAVDKETFGTAEGIDSIYKSWAENDWRGKKSLPTLGQLVEHAGLMKANQVRKAALTAAKSEQDFSISFFRTAVGG